MKHHPEQSPRPPGTCPFRLSRQRPLQLHSCSSIVLHPHSPSSSHYGVGSTEGLMSPLPPYLLTLASPSLGQRGSAPQSCELTEDFGICSRGSLAFLRARLPTAPLSISPSHHAAILPWLLVAIPRHPPVGLEQQTQEARRSEEPTHIVPYCNPVMSVSMSPHTHK